MAGLFHRSQAVQLLCVPMLMVIPHNHHRYVLALLGDGLYIYVNILELVWYA